MTVLPPNVVTAVANVALEAESGAVAALARSPGELLSVLAKVAHRSAEAAAPLIAAAERARLRVALLACTVCGTIHQPHPAATQLPGRKPHAYTSWAGADGHSYQTRFRDGHARQQVADLLGEAP